MGFPVAKRTTDGGRVPSTGVDLDVLAGQRPKLGC